MKRHGKWFSVIISFGPWGGFYLFNRFTKRICLGWLAITFIPLDVDRLFDGIFDGEMQDMLQGRKQE